MDNSLGLSQSVRKLLLVVFVLYFGLFVYSTVAGSAVAALTTNVLFGLLAIVVGTVLARQAPEPTSTLMGAAAGFLVAGVSQLMLLLTGILLFDALVLVGILLGLGLYFYTMWQANA